jgi:hypothetical protein
MTHYNTNLASEFWVLATLHRLGADASLTLGNKKAVDIIVTSEAGRAKTVDVKGVAGPYDWPADNIRLPGPKNHFYVFLSFEGRIQDPQQVPSCWIVPASQLKPLVRQYRTRAVISRKAMRESGAKYADAWWRLVGKQGR